MENTKILTEAQIEAIEKVAELVQKAVAWIVEVVKRVAECIQEIVRTILENYRNKRVIHLALHHGDKRVRKKNWNRIFRWYRKCRE